MDLRLNDWSEISDAATAASFFLLLGTIVVASPQVRAQFRASRRQTAFETFLHFSEKFTELATERSELKDQHESGALKNSRRAVKGFYQRYWALQIAEWEMFRARLLPHEIYASWLCYVHDNICGNDFLCYKQGKIVVKFTNSDAFKEVALGQMMRSQPACRDFFIKLSKIDSYSQRQWDEDAQANISQRLSQIRKLLRDEQRAYRRTQVWP